MIPVMVVIIEVTIRSFVPVVMFRTSSIMLRMYSTDCRNASVTHRRPRTPPSAGPFQELTSGLSKPLIESVSSSPIVGVSKILRVFRGRTTPRFATWRHRTARLHLPFRPKGTSSYTTPIADRPAGAGLARARCCAPRPSPGIVRPTSIRRPARRGGFSRRTDGDACLRRSPHTGPASPPLRPRRPVAPRPAATVPLAVTDLVSARASSLATPLPPRHQPRDPARRLSCAAVRDGPVSSSFNQVQPVAVMHARLRFLQTRDELLERMR